MILAPVNPDTDPRVTWSPETGPAVSVGVDAGGTPCLLIHVAVVVLWGPSQGTHPFLRVNPSSAQTAALLRGVLATRCGLFAVADWMEEKDVPKQVDAATRRALWDDLRKTEQSCLPTATAAAPPLPDPEPGDQYETV